MSLLKAKNGSDLLLPALFETSQMIPPGSMGSSASLTLPLTRFHWLVRITTLRFPLTSGHKCQATTSPSVLIVTVAGTCAGTMLVSSARAMVVVVSLVAGCLVSPLASGSFDPHGKSSVAGEMGASSVASSS